MLSVHAACSDCGGSGFGCASIRNPLYDHDDAEAYRKYFAGCDHLARDNFAQYLWRKAVARGTQTAADRPGRMSDSEKDVDRQAFIESFNNSLKRGE